MTDAHTYETPDANTATDTYTYGTLDTGNQSIRLLDILPDAANASLRAVLRTASLLDDPKPPYESISYVWGDATRIHSLEILNHDDQSRSSRTMLIPQSTEEALKRVRLEDRIRTVWIDAVCINQDDVEERSSQVLMMWRIYSNCVTNLVMLAPTMESSMAARIVKAVHWLYADAVSHTDNMRLFRGSVRQRGILNLTYEGFPAELDVDAVLTCCQLSWFQRLWVLQEATLSPISIVSLGPESLPLMHVLRALSWWMHKAEPQHILKPPEAFFGFNCVAKLQDLADQEYGSRSRDKRTHAALLHVATEFARSDPKDGIFAIVGLLDHDLPPDLKVDYKLPLGEILQRHTRYAVSMNYLSLLSYVRHRNDDLRSPDIPSWALRADRMYEPHFDPMLLPSLYHACKGLSNEPLPVSISGVITSVLGIRGIVVDSISKITPACPYTMWPVDIVQWLKKAFDLFPDSLDGVACDTAARAIAETCIVGRTWSGLTSDSDFEPVIEFVRAARAYFPSPYDNQSEIGDLLWKATNISSLKYIDHQKMFLTAKGSLGLGPGMMEVDDVVVLVRDIQAPLVLRPCADGRHQLVGAAYVRGIMYGEAVVAHKAAGGQEQIFELI